jgi:hypothetical protein
MGFSEKIIIVQVLAKNQKLKNHIKLQYFMVYFCIAFETPTEE